MKTMTDNFARLLDVWPCCTLTTVRILDLLEQERSFFASFMPRAHTAITLGHHVTTEEEWTWYATTAGGEHCAADDHAKDFCEAIKLELIKIGHQAELVSYPGESGLQFRYVAQASGLGVIGTNAFLFHPTWGPWIHLRVVATTAVLDIHPNVSGNQLCNQCALCISECPAGAISRDAFDGLLCRSYRRARGEYEPFGLRGEFRYCKRCVWVCPLGQQPQKRNRQGETVEQ
jgi:epoxyqueuosine reductase QueG